MLSEVRDSAPSSCQPPHNSDNVIGISWAFFVRMVANPLPVDRPENRDKKIVVNPGEEFRLRFGVQVHEHAKREDFDLSASYRRYLSGLQEASR